MKKQFEIGKTYDFDPNSTVKRYKYICVALNENINHACFDMRRIDDIYDTEYFSHQKLDDVNGRLNRGEIVEFIPGFKLQRGTTLRLRTGAFATVESVVGDTVYFYPNYEMMCDSTGLSPMEHNLILDRIKTSQYIVVYNPKN